jgi:terminal uridylyltransferase
VAHHLMTLIPPRSLPSSHFSHLNPFLEEFTAKLFPPPEFTKTLHTLLVRLNSLVSRLSVPGGRVYLFGSAANNFGTVSSDVDVCVAFPKNNEDEADPSAIVMELAKLLAEEGFIDVDDSRHAARIPIVIAHDPVSNLDVDICVNNLLAVRNTNLLKAYSLIDVRVRQLAYLIKYWVKKRRINTASEGTLCSYGYILMLIHFLQNTSPPILPILNDLPPSWTGEEVLNKPKDLPVIEIIGMDGVAYNTYFFEPREPEACPAFKTFTSRNKQSLASLFLDFLWSFAFDFEYRMAVVSTRVKGGIDREDKGRDYGWKRHSRLSIEDPFELGYDVAHVIKDEAHVSCVILCAVYVRATLYIYIYL